MQEQAMNNSTPLTDGANYTPIYKGKRVRMRADLREVTRTRGRGFQGHVTDLDTNIRYRVFGRDCGLNCYCDAEIEEDT
jgi:hypothetical protein